MKEEGIFDKLPSKFCGLVEEYRIELAKRSTIDLQLDVSLVGCTICGIHETILISKTFGFIGWLIQNDKIDFKKLEDNANWYYLDTANDYLDLIALLSIQDNPIELLISILK